MIYSKDLTIENHKYKLDVDTTILHDPRVRISRYTSEESAETVAYFYSLNEMEDLLQVLNRTSVLVPSLVQCLEDLGTWKTK